MSLITNFRRGNYPKKYKVEVDGVDYQFGDQRYEQFEDNTPLKLYSNLDHHDPARRRLYRLRHQHNKGIPARLSQIYLW